MASRTITVAADPILRVQLQENLRLNLQIRAIPFEEWKVIFIEEIKRLAPGSNDANKKAEEGGLKLVEFLLECIRDLRSLSPEMSEMIEKWGADFSAQCQQGLRSYDDRTVAFESLRFLAPHMNTIISDHKGNKEVQKKILLFKDTLVVLLNYTLPDGQGTNYIQLCNLKNSVILLKEEISSQEREMQELGMIFLDQFSEIKPMLALISPEILEEIKKWEEEWTNLCEQNEISSDWKKEASQALCTFSLQVLDPIFALYKGKMAVQETILLFDDAIKGLLAQTIPTGQDVEQVLEEQRKSATEESALQKVKAVAKACFLENMAQLKSAQEAIQQKRKERVEAWRQNVNELKATKVAANQQALERFNSLQERGRQAAARLLALGDEAKAASLKQEMDLAQSKRIEEECKNLSK